MTWPDDLSAPAVSPADLGESEAAFDHLFPLWYTGGHALAVGLLAALTARLLFVLRKPDVRDFYEYQDPDAPPVVPWAKAMRRG